MIGFVLLQRSIMDWEWYQHPTVSRLYVHLILKVNFIEKKWQGVTIKRGQLITSTNSLSAELKLSTQQIRTALTKLEEGNYIQKRATNNFTLITRVNYDKFQSADSTVNKPNNKQRTIQKQSNNIPLTTTKQRNNENKFNNETIELRKEKFKKQIFEHSQFSNKISTDFFNYWSELNIDKSKMRCEKDDFFNVLNRLKKWSENEMKVGFKKQSSNESKFSTNR